MKIKIAALIATLLFASLCFAEPQLICFSNYAAPLTDDCSGNGGNGNRLPAGTTVYIYLDANGNGYDNTDPQPARYSQQPEGLPNQLRINAFVMNAPDGAGTFDCAETGYIATGGGMYMDGTPRLYLLVPLPGNSHVWISDVVTLERTGLPQDFEITQWTCHPSGVNAVDPSGALIPTEFSMSAYPNPFNPTTSIRIALPQASQVKLSLFDITGRLVKVLADEQMQAGYHEIPFDGKNFASGLYFSRIESGIKTETQKLVLMK